MGDWIDDLKEKAQQKKADETRKEEIKAHKYKAIASKLPFFWKEFLEHIDTQCSKLKEIFPNEEKYHFSRTASPTGGFQLTQGQYALPKLTVDPNFAGHCIYVSITSSLRTEITVDADDNDRLVLQYKNSHYMTAKELAEKLMQDCVS